MSIKLKSFIYRFSDVFGLSIYLAKEEEELYIELLQEAEGPLSEFSESMERALWQVEAGFTTVFTYKQPWYKSAWSKLKHAFNY